MQKWKKLGCIFSPNNTNPYLISHAANPLPFKIDGNVYRIFYSGRNKDNKSSVGYVDIDIYSKSIKQYPKEPLLKFDSGENSFYQDGISIGCYFEYKYTGQIDFFFMGWQNPKNSHWRGEIGRFSVIGLTENPRVQNITLFMGRDAEDSISLSYPFIIHENGIFKIWYGSTVTWDAGNNEMIHVIKYATSTDGLIWEKKGIAIPYEVGIAQAFSRPCVIVDKNGYHMWYSFRSGDGSTYRIGYANSKDGILWNRLNKNEVGIDISPSGWDSEMICYPYVFDHNGNRYMLYNGNGYGKTGFGLAVLEQD